MSEDPTGGASLYKAARAAGVEFAREAYPTDGTEFSGSGAWAYTISTGVTRKRLPFSCFTGWPSPPIHGTSQRSR